MPQKELILVTGIQSNYRTLLPEGIEEGDRHGYTTRILDLNALVPAWAPYKNEWAALGIASRVDTIDDFDALKQFTRNHPAPENATILFLYPPAGAFCKAWKILGSRFPHIGLITLSPVPDAKRLIDTKQTLTVTSAIMRLLRKIKSLIKPVPTVWVVSGSQAIPVFASFFRNFRDTRFIYAHSIEYESYFHNSKIPPGFSVPDTNYLLVLDQGWFSKPKPDFLTDQQYPPTSRDKFSTEMGRFLEHIVSQTGLDIVVSCHPKADLEDTRALYPGYNVVNHPSSDLIRHCTAALAHTSTSIGYAVMADKPVILFTNNELRQSILRHTETAFSKELGIEYHNMSNEGEFDSEQALGPANKANYDRYMERYIRQPRSREMPLWPLLYSELGATP